MTKPTDPEAQAAMDEWADKIAALEADVAAGVMALASRMASDRRLAADDRRFAKSQADAVRRALRRTKSKAAKASKPGHKPSKKN
jgi:hypothetical protein